MNVDLGLMYTIVGFVGSLGVYVFINVPSKRRELKMGLLLFAYVRDIYKLITSKLITEWSEYSIPQKLDMLKAIYDTIESFSEVKQSKKLPNDVDLLDEVNKI